MINLRFFTLALGVAMAHLYCGLVILLGTPVVVKVAPLALLSFLSANWLGVLLIAASLAAFFAFTFPKLRTLYIIWLIAPQQIFLLFSLVSVLLSIYSGHYPDGYPPDGDGLFISVDQIWLLTVCFWHTIEYGAIFVSKRLVNGL